MNSDKHKLNKNLAQMLKGGVIMLVTAFHPELTNCLCLHQYFIEMVML